MEIKLTEIAKLVGGTITGNGDINITGLAKIEEAKSGDLTFLYLDSYQKYFTNTQASAILVKPGFNKTREDITYIEVKDPNKSLTQIVVSLLPPKFPLEGIDKTAFVHTEAVVGKNTALGKNVVVSKGCKIGDNVKIFHNTVLLENAEVGDDSLIFQNVSVREECKIGKRCIIHPGAVVGSDGFGFHPGEDGAWEKIPQIGNVIIEDDVEIGANVTIDRAALGSTLIKRGVKIDNLVQIAHNVVLGENIAIAAQAGISGSTKIGRNCLIAGQVGVVGHLEIADKVTIYAQSGVSKSITESGVTYFGSPAKEYKTALKIEAHMRNLPQYAEKIKQLEAEIKLLKEKTGL
ncbi:MAG: UDP-3-O-(3-hydroxymyristoyl)glucosamine N-acyltransferase [Ignavibacteria bacterium CG2_30_36_16]|nr:UDP-3-O-(3-hydroxymyristoyl)glucosamine N-acyltransferase [Ignavibacteria bacterium]OIP63914.1 MAG: UDP-3-O-(3-hydroxymyristoyl)glucosamine N-acyltransferase [Ignavibacteria bacterium CG2_30_36_16]